MNDDLISRSALEAEFRRRADTFDKELGGDLFHISEIVMVIDNAPTVELEPFCKVTLDEDKLREIVDELRQEIIDGEIVLTEKKKTGHWNYARFGNQTLVKCSECEEEFLGNDVSDYNFCPNCGADMRGKENE